MFKPQKKHKANHGGYKKRPAKKEVDAYLSMYQELMQPQDNKKPKQLQIKFA